MNEFISRNNYFERLLITSVFFSIFILPINALNELNFPLDKYIFIFFVTLYYVNFMILNKKVKVKDIFLLILLFLIILIKKEIYHIHLISLIVLDKLIYDEKYIHHYLYKSKILFLALFFSIIYTIIYFGYGSRYIFTGIKEINQGGFSLILLFLMIEKKYEKLGFILLCLGLFTFSRSYFLAFMIYILFKVAFLNKIFLNRLTLKFLGNFKIMSILSIILLIMLSNYFLNSYNMGELVSYGRGMERFLHVKDRSNYFRFTVNTNLIKIYILEPFRLFTGIKNEEFINLNRSISLQNKQLYRPIRPHNYFFSYIQIYGIYSLFIFLYLGGILKKLICEKNLMIFLIVFSYMIFLGTATSSYWLYLSIFALIVYKFDYKGENNGRNNNNNKNI